MIQKDPLISVCIAMASSSYFELPLAYILAQWTAAALSFANNGKHKMQIVQQQQKNNNNVDDML